MHQGLELQVHAHCEQEIGGGVGGVRSINPQSRSTGREGLEGIETRMIRRWCRCSSALHTLHTHVHKFSAFWGSGSKSL